jgi:hypothetical protein
LSRKAKAKVSQALALAVLSPTPPSQRIFIFALFCPQMIVFLPQQCELLLLEVQLLLHQLLSVLHIGDVIEHRLQDTFKTLERLHSRIILR